MGSGLPQFGFPRRFAIDFVSLERCICAYFLGNGLGEHLSLLRKLQLLILRIFSSKINKKMPQICTKMPVCRFAHFFRTRFMQKGLPAQSLSLIRHLSVPCQAKTGHNRVSVAPY
jgi:hypothetical protein